MATFLLKSCICSPFIIEQCLQDLGKPVPLVLPASLTPPSFLSLTNLRSQGPSFSSLNIPSHFPERSSLEYTSLSIFFPPVILFQYPVPFIAINVNYNGFFNFVFLLVSGLFYWTKIIRAETISVSYTVSPAENKSSVTTHRIGDE